MKYEEAAEYVEKTLKGWVCKKCRIFYSESEHSARYCCCTSKKCDVEGCNNRTEQKYYCYCSECADKRRTENYNKKTEVEWESESYVFCNNNDKYYEDEESLFDGIDEDEIDIKELQLHPCIITDIPQFCIEDHLTDYLPEDYILDYEITDEYNIKINNLIKELIAKTIKKTFEPDMTKRISLKNIINEYELRKKNEIN